MLNHKLTSCVGVLKQVKDGYSNSQKTVSGIVRIETINGVSTVFASFINFSYLSGEEYFLFIQNAKKQLVRIPLGKRPTSITKTLEDVEFDDSGFSAGVCALEHEIPLLIAFLKTENFSTTLLEFKKSVAEYCLSAHKRKCLTIEKVNTCPVKKVENRSYISEYNDEIVATENYYELRESENAVKTEGERVENLPNENDDVITFGIKKTQESQTSASIGEDENDNSSKKSYNEYNPYYKKARKELDNIFERFPKDTTLNKLFPTSRWVKIFYEKEKFYVVGVIYENDKEKYICYGIPGEYSRLAPKELKGFCSFVPESIFSLTGKGYWMMFQDAITGKCVKNAN